MGTDLSFLLSDFKLGHYLEFPTLVGHAKSAANSLHMPSHNASFESFERELNRLVASFGQRLAELKQPGYAEAQLRSDFLDPFFSALGWDMTNRAGLIQKHREVEIESRTEIAGRKKRADYLFRTDTHDRFVCEAKKPVEELTAKYAFQAKRYAWNKGLALAVLSDFEEFKIYIVGGKPRLDEPLAGLWKTWHFRELPLLSREIWDLFARASVATGSIDKLVEALPKRPVGKGKARQPWLLKPDRSRSLDVEFLNLLDTARRELASDLLKHNDREDLLEGTKLNEAVQRILDRILFLRICEDRDIDTGTQLDSLVKIWRRNYGKDDGRRAHQEPLELRDEPPADYGISGIRAPKDSLWRVVVRHFRALDRRPPSHIPFFNGNLFKPHFSEELLVSDEWLAGFIADLSDDESPYLFNYIAVEILGTIYERFLGKIVRPQGRGVTIEEKPEVRKAGGVYYTPRYIVEYIVAQTVEKLLHDARPETTLKLRFLDPACGSGSFLIRVFESVCEHWQQWLTDRPADRKKKWCWVDETTGDVHLTMTLKRQILTSNVFGVDLDAGAVEVTQLSLYLKMLEDENRNTLKRQRELLPDDDDPLLPPLEHNIKCGNSLIASNFLEGELPTEEAMKTMSKLRAFDWSVGFEKIMKAGGFDAVIGNPPYVRQESLKETKDYFEKNYESFSGTGDLYTYFMEKGVKLIRPGGRYSIIVSSSFLRATYAEALRETLLKHAALIRIVDFGGLAVFADAKDTYVCIPVLAKEKQPDRVEVSKVKSLEKDSVMAEMSKTDFGAPLRQFTRDAWVLKSAQETKLFAKVMAAGMPLGEYVERRFFRGVTSGLNEAFVIDAATRARLIKEHKRSAELIHPVRGGEDVREYFIGSADTFLIFTRRGVNIEDYPAIKRHLETFRADLTPRKSDSDRRGRKPGAYRWYEIQDDVAYYEVFHKPKLVFPDICKHPRFSYDDTGVYLANTAYALGTGDKYLLGILNSRLFWFAISNISIPFGVRAGEFRYRLIYQYMERVPVRKLDLKKPAEKAAHGKMVDLVNRRLALSPRLRAATGSGEKATLQNAVTATDHQIDALVYDLYELTPEEIALVEGGR